MSCRIFTYSPQNKYASAYYNACNQYDKISAQLGEYERKYDDRESYKYNDLVAKFTYWDAKVPETSNIAGVEENKIAEKQEKEQAKAPKDDNAGNVIDYMA